jgi:hypothetical protein
MAAAVSEALPPAAVAVPPHVVVAVDATTARFAGSVLANLAAVRATEFVFDNVIVAVACAPGAMLAGVNAIATPGPLRTVRDVDAALVFAPAFVVATLPMAIAGV